MIRRASSAITSHLVPAFFSAKHQHMSSGASGRHFTLLQHSSVLDSPPSALPATTPATRSYSSNPNGLANILKDTYHMRALPKTCIPLSSDQGNVLFDESWRNGMAEGLLDILPYIEGQTHITYCALASIVTVLNTLRVDPGRVWKGPFRWYDETLLADEEVLQEVKTHGLTLDQAVDLIPKDKVSVKTRFASESSLEEFRDLVRFASSSSGSFIISAYGRRVLQQTGDGHFSPIGAYHPATDSVLILDVARYKYPLIGYLVTYCGMP